MHADEKSTLTSVSKWNSVKVNYAETALFQGDSVGGSKLTEQTLIRRSYKKKIGILKIHGVQKEKQIYVFTWAASSSHNISFLNRCILPLTAEDMNLLTW